MTDLKQVLENLRGWRDWEKTGYNHASLCEAIEIIEALQDELKTKGAKDDTQE